MKRDTGVSPWFDRRLQGDEFEPVDVADGSFSTKPTDRFAILPFSIGTGVRLALNPK